MRAEDALAVKGFINTFQKQEAAKFSSVKLLLFAYWHYCGAAVAAIIKARL